MANGWKLCVSSISTDGTNLYFTVLLNDGVHTLPPVTPEFPVGTTAAVINAYLQAIVDNGYNLTADIAALSGKTYLGA